MGGDQFNQLISEYLKKNGPFVTFMIILMVLCVLAVITGIVLHFVMNAKAKTTPAIATPNAGVAATKTEPVTTAKQTTPLGKPAAATKTTAANSKVETKTTAAKPAAKTTTKK